MRQGTLRGLLALVVLSVLGSTLLQRYMGHVMDEPDLDFYDYYFEAAAVHDHPRLNMYTPALGGNPQLRWAPSGSEVYQRAEAAGFNGTNLYLYPPVLADLLIPVSYIAPRHAAMLWRGFNLVLIVSVTVRLAAWLGLQVLSAETGLILFAAYACWPVHETISQGQISIVLLALWTLGIVSYTSGRVALSALAFALATWLKVTPLLILPVFLILNTRRERRWTAWYIAANLAIAAGVVAINGFENLVSSFRVLMEMSGGVPALANKSLGSVVYWLYYGHPTTYPEARILINQPQPTLVVLASKVLSLGFYVACLAQIWRLRRINATLAPQVQGLILATFAVILSLASPVSWRHGYSTGLIMFFILWVNVLRMRKVSVTLGLLLTVASVSVGSLIFDLGAQAPLPGLLKVLLASFWPVSCALLCFFVLYEAGRTVYKGNSPPELRANEQAHG
ncbi:MAG: glycosyltransferase family 87 protein [Janthinobacterium lividum]